MERARALLGGPGGPAVTAQLRDLLAARGWFHPIPAYQNGTEAMVVVDGADIAEPTDTLIWLTAVSASSDRHHEATHWQVAPPGDTASRIMQTAMAILEMSVATRVCEHNPGPSNGLPAVWMDGALGTPLVTVVVNLPILAANSAAGEALSQVLDDLNADQVITAYIAAATSGLVAALPKRDTQTGYTSLWSTAACRAGNTALARHLDGAQDRRIVTGILPPGHYLTARREAATSTVDAPRDLPGATPAYLRWSRLVGDLLDRWAAGVDPHALYATSLSLPGHPVKIEFNPAGHHPATLAGRLAALTTSEISGPWMREPYPQHSVDKVCKDLVRGSHSALLAAAAVNLGGDFPHAITSYRT